MCPAKETTKLLGGTHRENTEIKVLRSKDATGGFGSAARGAIAESASFISEGETAPVKIKILQIKKESLIAEVEEDPTKPWYFAHV